MLTISEEVAKNIRYFRKKAKLSQGDFAKRLGVTFAAVSNWERCRNSIDIDVLFAACDILGVSPSDIFGIYAGDGLTEHERKVITAYRAAPKGAQDAIDKILDVVPELGENNQSSQILA